jgi:hypothetical protein
LFDAARPRNHTAILRNAERRDIQLALTRPELAVIMTSRTTTRTAIGRLTLMGAAALAVLSCCCCCSASPVAASRRQCRRP